MMGLIGKAVKGDLDDIQMPDSSPPPTPKKPNSPSDRPVQLKAFKARQRALADKFVVIANKIDTKLDQNDGVVVNTFYHGESSTAPLNKEYDYEMLLKLHGANPFILHKTVLLNDGPYKGHCAVLFRQSLPFPVMKLNAELRGLILRFALHTDSGDVKMTVKQAGNKSTYAPEYSTPHRLALLSVSHSIRDEALPILFEQRFCFPSTQALSGFLLQIGNTRKYLQYLRCDTYNPPTARTVFHLITDCKHLQYLSFKHVSSNEQPKTAVKNMFNDAHVFLTHADFKDDPLAGLRKLGFDKSAFHMRNKTEDGSYLVTMWGPKEQITFAANLKDKVMAAHNNKRHH